MNATTPLPLPLDLTPEEQVIAEQAPAVLGMIPLWADQPAWAEARRQGMRLVRASGPPSNPLARWRLGDFNVQPVFSVHAVRFFDEGGRGLPALAWLVQSSADIEETRVLTEGGTLIAAALESLGVCVDADEARLCAAGLAPNIERYIDARVRAVIKQQLAETIEAVKL